jgi:hypothetical protein
MVLRPGDGEPPSQRSHQRLLWIVVVSELLCIRPEWIHWVRQVLQHVDKQPEHMRRLKAFQSPSHVFINEATRFCVDPENCPKQKCILNQQSIII